MECRISRNHTGQVSGREGHVYMLLPSLTPFGLLGGEANGQCVPVRGVRSDLLASDRPGSVMLNHWWPDMPRRQPPPVGSRSRYCMSRCLWSGRSQMVFYRDLVRPCNVLLVMEGFGMGKRPSGRVGITERKAEPTRCKESDGPIVVMTPLETWAEVPLSAKGPGIEPKAICLRRGLSLVGADEMNVHEWYILSRRPGVRYAGEYSPKTLTPRRTGG
jgi:hypothetical protein